MKLEFHEYHARKIVNVHKHVDGPWFWGKYTAHPYIGCRSGCEFCYARGSRYLGRRDPDTFDTQIGVKVNAVELLQAELPSLEREIIAAGDWQQPAETAFGSSVAGAPSRHAAAPPERAGRLSCVEDKSHPGGWT